MPTERYINDKFTIDELIRRSWDLRNSKDFTKFISFVARFNHYSRFNTMLVYLQNEEVTFFGGESYWKKKFNRTIKKDARPYIILAPMSPVMLVYDVMETEGEESPEDFLKEGLGENPFRVRGQIQHRIFYNAQEIAKSWGIPTQYKPLSFFNAGYITTAMKGCLEIWLKKGMSVEQNFTTLLHELAHLFLGHTGHQGLKNIYTEKKLKLLGKRHITRSVEELEAETVSFLISKKFGLETRSAEYIAGYIKNVDDLLSFSYETVIKTADKIEKMFLKTGQISISKKPQQTTLF